MTEYWDGLLKEIRTCLKLSAQSDAATTSTSTTTEIPSSSPLSPASTCQETNIISLCESHFDEISHLLLEYVSTATASVRSSSHPRKPTYSDPIHNDRGENQRNDDSCSPSLSAIASNVYRALRFVLAAVSCAMPTTREKIQLLTISTLNNNNADNIRDTNNPRAQPLYISICDLIGQPRIHAKNRNLAAKILCNIGTCNRKTAQVLLCDIRPSPRGGEEVTRFMLEKLSCHLEQDVVKKDEGVVHPSCQVTCTATTTTTTTTCWSQMVYTCGKCGDRGSLAAVVAALYNSIHSFIQDLPSSHDDGDDDDDDDDDENVQYIKSVYVCDAILLSNLVRYILPCQVIQPTTYVTGKDNHQEDLSDDATEWISRLMEKFSSMGLFPSMYAALGGQEEEEECDSLDHVTHHKKPQEQEQQAQYCGMLPEQLVLLHCVGSSLDEYERNFCTSKQRKDTIHPLGDDLESMKKSCQFLAQLYCNLRQRLRCKENVQERYDGEISCIENGSNVILDVLSSCLSTSVAEPFMQDVDILRRELGQSTNNIVKVIVEDLGLIVDRLDYENRGINARELTIKQCDQHHVTSLVRLIANICYKCQWNQDLVRMTPVPISFVKDTKHDSRRNGLHVLLSCTSFAYGCFTLREWAIVAIRNVLEDNQENQKQVEELEAQQALNTPELEKLGVQVHLDRKGHVHVSPKE